MPAKVNKLEVIHHTIYEIFHTFQLSLLGLVWGMTET